ncbi:MAG: YihY/virulence factor BrkB family protein [Actinomycetota bacterium]
MNVFERGIRRVDKVQQRHTPSAFVVGVVKKYGDDNGGTLASSLAHSALVSVFPLLLVLITILGLVASGDEALRTSIINAAGQQVPLIGNQLTGHLHALRRSSLIGLIFGLVGLLWGATGLAQSSLFTMEQVWNLPGPARPGFLPRLGRALLFLGVLGTGVIVTTMLTSLDTFGNHSAAVIVLAQVLALLANVGLYFASFRVLTPKGVPSRSLFWGAVVGGVAWTVLQAVGTLLVAHYQQSDSAYGVFATVLALVAWLYIAVQVTVYAAEVNVVLARRLWPRSLMQPPLTEADRAGMALQALQNQRRDEQQITVSFTDRPPGEEAAAGTPSIPGEVAPPATSGDPAPSGGPTASGDHAPSSGPAPSGESR